MLPIPDLLHFVLKSSSLAIIFSILPSPLRTGEVPLQTSHHAPCDTHAPFTHYLQSHPYLTIQELEGQECDEFRVSGAHGSAKTDLIDGSSTSSNKYSHSILCIFTEGSTEN